MPVQYYQYNIVKIDDQTVSDDTLTPDNDLKFFMSENVSYNIEALISINVAGLLPIYTWTIDGPSGFVSVIAKNELMLLGSTSVAISTQNSYNTENFTVGLSASSAILRINCIVKNGGNSGIFSLNFACSSGTSVTNAAGSYLRYTFGITV